MSLTIKKDRYSLIEQSSIPIGDLILFYTCGTANLKDACFEIVCNIYSCSYIVSLNGVCVKEFSNLIAHQRIASRPVL